MQGQGRVARCRRRSAALEWLEGRQMLSLAAETGTPVSVEVETLSATTALQQQEAGDAELAALSAMAQSTGVDSVEHNRIQGPDPGAPSLLGAEMLTRGDRAFGFVLRFSEPLEPTGAGDVRNYRVFHITRPNKWLARMLYQSDAANANSLKIRRATYVPEQNSVVLTFASPEKLDGSYRVGLSNPARTLPARMRVNRPPMIQDLDGHTIAPPVDRRGRVVRTALLVKPKGRIKLELLEPGNNSGDNGTT